MARSLFAYVDEANQRGFDAPQALEHFVATLPPNLTMLDLYNLFTEDDQKPRLHTSSLEWPHGALRHVVRCYWMLQQHALPLSWLWTSPEFRGGSRLAYLRECYAMLPRGRGHDAGLFG